MDELDQWLFRSSSFRSSLFSQVATHPWYKVCLSTASLSRGLFRAGQTSAAKGIFAAHTGSLKKTGSFDWIQLAARLLAAVGNLTKKKVTACAGFIGVRWRQVGNPTKTKAKISPTFHTFTGLLRLNELSVDVGVQRWETRAADKLRTNERQTLLFYRYRFQDVFMMMCCYIVRKFQLRIKKHEIDL